MKSLGMWMVILGLGSFLLSFANMDFILVSWMDNWGASTGVVLRIALAVVGAILWLVARKREGAATPAA